MSEKLNNHEPEVRDTENTEWNNLWEPYAAALTVDDIRNRTYDPDKLPRTAEDFRLDPTDYKVIINQQVVDLPKHKDERTGQYVKRDTNIDEAAALMVHSAQKLIYRIDSLDQAENPRPDELIYLDKSGRPVSWLVNTFWSDFALKSENGHPHPRPPHSFVNIDRGTVLENFFGMTKLSGDRIKDKNGDEYDYYSDAWEAKKPHLTTEHLAKLRALYLDDPAQLTPNITPNKIMQLPSRLDGKNLLIIDEVKSTRATSLDMAKTLFERAFPGAKVRTTVFWDESADESVPVWYDRVHTEGRGIGEVDPAYYDDLLEKSEDSDYLKSAYRLTDDQLPEVKNKLLPRARAKHYGKLLLSTPTNLATERGQLSRNLMADFKQLHQDYLAHRILPLANGHGADITNRANLEIVHQGINPLNYIKIQKSVFSRNNPSYPK